MNGMHWFTYVNHLDNSTNIWRNQKIVFDHERTVDKLADKLNWIDQTCSKLPAKSTNDNISSLLEQTIAIDSSARNHDAVEHVWRNWKWLQWLQIHQLLWFACKIDSNQFVLWQVRFRWIFWFWFINELLRIKEILKISFIWNCSKDK